MPSTSSNEKSWLNEFTRLRLTDSPWLWLAIFSFAGLMGSFAIGPKYVQREGRLERMQHVRETVDIWDGQQTAARRDAADNSGTPVGTEPHLAAENLENPPLSVPLQPLSLFFLTLTVVGVVGLLWSIRKSSHSSKGKP